MDVTEKNNSKEITLDKLDLTKRTTKVLLVEDDSLAAKIEKSILSHCDCHIDVAVDGRKAFELLDSEHYDLIFLDIGLPNMSGYEVAKRIRSHPLTSIGHIPIVALTAHTNTENQQLCLDAKINAVLSKPMTLDRAKSVLDTFVSRRKRFEDAISTDGYSMQKNKVLDFEYAKRLFEGNEIIARELVIMLIDGLPEEVVRLREAYQEKNGEALSAIAHKLKGAASYCGALRLKAICTELENYINSGLTARISDLYQQMLAEIEALQSFIKNH